MLKTRSPWRWPLFAGVIVAGALATAAAVAWEPAPDPWQVTAVSFSGTSAAGSSLLVEGQGLHDGLQAMLVPAKAGGSSAYEADLSVPLYRFATDGRLAIASTRDHRLITLDVTKGRLPNVLGGLTLPLLSQTLGGTNVNALALLGDRVVVVRSNSGLFLVDVADPAKPRQVDSLGVSKRLLDIYANGDVAYIVSDQTGLLMVTFAGDRLVANWVPGSLPAIRLAGDRRRLVTAGGGGVLALYELDSQGRPQQTGTLKVPGEIRDLTMTPEHLYVCTDAGQLLAFALDAWPHLVPAGQLDLKGRPLKMAWMAASRRLYCSLVGSGVAIVEETSSSGLRSAGVLSMPKTPISLQASGDRLFLTGGGD